MDLKETQANWDALGASDALYGVLSHDGKRGGKWDEAEFFATGRAEIEGVLAQAASHGLGFPRRTALDFGCAVGRLSQALALHFESVTGVDIAPSMLELAARYDKSGGRCRYVLNDSPDLRLFSDGAFDFIYSNIVLQHMAPEFALKYIAEFVRVLSPGGLLVFQIPERAQYAALRKALKALTPKPLLALYRKLRYGQVPAHEIEMNGVAPAKVAAMIEAAGGRLRHSESGVYWVQK